MTRMTKLTATGSLVTSAALWFKLWSNVWTSEVPDGAKQLVNTYTAVCSKLPVTLLKQSVPRLHAHWTTPIYHTATVKHKLILYHSSSPVETVLRKVLFEQYRINRGWAVIVGLRNTSGVTVVLKCSRVHSFLPCSPNAQHPPLSLPPPCRTWLSIFSSRVDT